MYTFQGRRLNSDGDNLNKACKCSTGIRLVKEFPSPDFINITVSFKSVGANPITLKVHLDHLDYHRDKGTAQLWYYYSHLAW